MILRLAFRPYLVSALTEPSTRADDTGSLDAPTVIRVNGFVNVGGRLFVRVRSSGEGLYGC
jgi:hypothetical protein